jgi:uncharacterized protein (DUF1330 family)
MVAYWLARATVNDPERYKKYAEAAPAILQKYGGRFLARGGTFEILEGPKAFGRFVVIEFPSLDQAVACHASAEYQAAARHRQQDGVSELKLVIVEGLN